MEPKKSDIRSELESRIVEVQKQIVGCLKKKDEVNKVLKKLESKLNALQMVYENEAERVGVKSQPLFVGKGAPSRFTGMRLVDALDIVRQENRQIDKRQALKILQKEGFDFRGKRPLPAVHFAWVALDRRGRRRK